MKRLMPTSLVNFLLANRTGLVKADCFVITLPTGAVMYVTEGQFDITFPAGTPGWSGGQVTFSSTQYGNWSRGPISSEAGFKLSAGTMKLTCIPQQGTQFPNLSLGMGSAALNHLLDAATVWVYTAYFPVSQYGNVSNGIETKFQGTITKAPSLSRNKIEFECADPFYLLNMKVPSRLLQANCGWSFCDDNCTLNVADYTVGFEADSGSTQTLLIPTTLTALPQADGYFTQGVVTCTSGANAGLSQTVKIHASGRVTVMVPWILPIAIGDMFSVLKGCNKTISTCKTTKQANGTVIDNSRNFEGTPFAPVPNSAF